MVFGKDNKCYYNRRTLILMDTAPSHISKDSGKALEYEEKLRRIMIETRGMTEESYLAREDYLKSVRNYDNKVPLEFPTTVNIELLNKCNYKCSMCYTVNHEGPAIGLKLGDFEKIVDECKQNGLMTLFIANGSEPLIYPGKKSAVKYALRIYLMLGYLQMP